MPIPPDTSLYYFPARTDLDVKVSRLLACSPDDEIFSSQTVTAATINRADVSRPIELDLGLLNSTFADTSFTAELHEDGRLKGINVTETGKAKEIVKSATSLAKLFLATALDGSSNRFPKLCGLIAAEKDEVLALEYEGPVTFDNGIDSWIVPLSTGSQNFASKAIAAGAEMSPLELRVMKGEVDTPVVPEQTARSSGISFKYPAWVTLILVSQETELWREKFAIAHLGADRWLPISRAPAFGKATTVIDLNENGSLQKVAYGSESGAVGVLDAAAEVTDVLDGATDTERAAAAEAEMKRIKSERDLLKCRADPSTC